MKALTIWDHCFVIIAVCAIPFYVWRSYPSFVESVRRRGEPARIAGYRETIVLWLGAAMGLAAIWLGLGRPWADLGFRWGDPLRFGLGLGFGLVLLWITRRELRRLASGGPSAITDRLGEVHIFLPRTARELGWFRGMAINAGITEELIFRGFLLWYLEPFVGLGWAAVAAVAAFTLAHAYQGLAQVPALVFTSACFVGLYLGTGSLLLPIVLHALIDILQGAALAKSLDPARETTGHPMQAAGE